MKKVIWITGVIFAVVLVNVVSGAWQLFMDAQSIAEVACYGAAEMWMAVLFTLMTWPLSEL